MRQELDYRGYTAHIIGALNAPIPLLLAVQSDTIQPETINDQSHTEIYCEPSELTPDDSLPFTNRSGSKEMSRREGPSRGSSGIDTRLTLTIISSIKFGISGDWTCLEPLMTTIAPVLPMG